MQPIQIFAGKHAYRHIAQQGLSPADIRVIVGASGGPKWFVLSHLDRYLIQNWLPCMTQTVDLIGSSIGAWRMAAYASDKPMHAIEHLEYHYLNQRYGDKVTAADVTRSVHALLDGFINVNDVDKHHNRKLHIVAARSKLLSRFEHKAIQTSAFASVALGNALTRRSLPFWFDRAVFHSEGADLPIERWDQFKTHHIALSRQNYRDALLASGAIPVVIAGVKNPDGAPEGMYRDGGMVDYHFDLPFKPNNGLVLYPHFVPMLKPGWFDKPLKWRKVQADNYSHTVVVSPSQQFVDALPYGKIPDRKDFERLDNDSRIQYWQTVVDRNKAIADAFDDWVNRGARIDAVQPIEHIAR